MFTITEAESLSSYNFILICGALQLSIQLLFSAGFLCTEIRGP